MSRRGKIGRNELCPCASGQKFKHCCEGKIDWEEITRTGADWRRYLSIRGRNIYFVNRIAEIIGLDSGEVQDLSTYKSRFTAGAVRAIHEAILEAWPPDLDIESVLSRASSSVSGLYIGDYSLDYIKRGIVRHSIYANKILVIDPFIYGPSVRDQFNPILEPEQYRAQTLKNVNFWLSLLPWMEAGIIEIIQTPADFDPQLNWDSLKRQTAKFEQNEQLKAAMDCSVKEMRKRHGKKLAFQQLILGAPDDYLKRKVGEIGAEKDGYTADDFLDYVNTERARDPDFLEPIGQDSDDGQVFTMSSGTSYDIAQLTASITNSYLVTDIPVKWLEIELDRESHNAESIVWTPFAKAFHEAPLRYLNQMQLDHALKIREEGRLDALTGDFFTEFGSTLVPKTPSMKQMHGCLPRS